MQTIYRSHFYRTRLKLAYTLILCSIVNIILYLDYCRDKNRAMDSMARSCKQTADLLGRRIGSGDLVNYQRFLDDPTKESIDSNKLKAIIKDYQDTFRYNCIYTFYLLDKPNIVIQLKSTDSVSEVLNSTVQATDESVLRLFNTTSLPRWSESPTYSVTPSKISATAVIPDQSPPRGILGYVGVELDAKSIDKSLVETYGVMESYLTALVLLNLIILLVLLSLLHTWLRVLNRARRCSPEDTSISTERIMSVIKNFHQV